MKHKDDTCICCKKNKTTDNGYGKEMFPLQRQAFNTPNTISLLQEVVSSTYKEYGFSHKTCVS